MTTYYKYQIKCSTEDIMKHWILANTDTAPTTCPTDCAHTVDLNTVAVVEIISPNIVDIKQGSQETGQNFCSESITIDVATGPNVTTEYSLSWPIGLIVLLVRTYVEEIHRDDVVTNVVAPNTIIGILTATEETGANTLHVSSTVIDNTMIGYNLGLLNTNNGHTNDCGRVVAIDKTNNIVTIETALTETFQAVTYVRQTIYTIRNYRLSGSSTQNIGLKRLYGSYLPANVPVKVRYTNNSAVAKKFVVYVDYMY